MLRIKVYLIDITKRQAFDYLIENNYSNILWDEENNCYTADRVIA